MGWPFNIFSRQKRYKHYTKSGLRKVGNTITTDWVLIEPDGKYHYGFMDAGLVNFPTYNYDIWYAPSFRKNIIEISTNNCIKIIDNEEDGPKNPWARLFGYEIGGPLIFKSDFPFSSIDIELLEKK